MIERQCVKFPVSNSKRVWPSLSTSLFKGILILEHLNQRKCYTLVIIHELQYLRRSASVAGSR